MELQAGPSPRTTMRDVAERAQVSLKTVSRVINGEPGVASATAARVTQSIAELGFRRNDLARSLRQGSTSATLGLVIEDVANPFYSAVAQAVENAARERGYLLITGSCEEDPERERELIQALMGRRVDALLLVPAGRERDHRLARARGARDDAGRLPRPPAARDRGRHGPARQRGRRARRGRAPARQRPPPDRLRRRRAGALHRERATRRLPRRPGGGGGRARSAPDQSRPRRDGAPVARAVAARASPGGGADGDLHRQQPPHASARCAPCAGASTRSRWSGSTTSSSPSCWRCRRPSSRHDSFRMGTEAAALAFARLDGSTAPSQRARPRHRARSPAAPGRCRHAHETRSCCRRTCCITSTPAAPGSSALRGVAHRRRPHARGVARRGQHDVRRRTTAAGSRSLDDGTLVRDAVAADPEALARPRARRALRRRPVPADQAARRRPAPAGALPSGPRVRARGARASPTARPRRGS